ncbi:hypothetical protein ES705_10955 [subsurface metagenome]
MPVRPVRVHCRKTEVTLPSYVARKIGVVAGNFVVWCLTAIPGVFAIDECAAVYKRDIDGLPIMGRMLGTSMVRKSSGSYELTIPKEVQAELGELTGKSIIFGLTHNSDIVTTKAVVKTEVSEELEKMLMEGHWGWPPLVEDCTQAWLEGFEPFAKDMAEIELPPRYPRRDRRNLYRAAVVFQIMIGKGAKIIEIQRRNKWSSMD